MEIVDLPLYGVMEFDAENEDHVFRVIIGIERGMKSWFRSAKVIELNETDGYAKVEKNCIIKLGRRSDRWAWSFWLKKEPEHAQAFMPARKD